eukprot:TRINITY_DN7899_c0_g1_i2.p1 TRINITY_DN7899_c0_g1~~TRINITY_DN7899_c0_g1_i2.p1  ORF type:complete len:435 (-),score=163.36 TRINITY_DN7899_c0_g1_i2:131-1435(-)
MEMEMVKEKEKEKEKKELALTPAPPPPPTAAELESMLDPALLAAAAAQADPDAEKRKQQELKAARDERSKKLRRGPGVAALVQGALKRAQDAPAVKKEEFVESQHSKSKLVEKILKKGQEEDDTEDRMEKLAREAAEKKREKEQQKEQAAKERREKAKQDAAEAEKALEKEALTREQRVKASVEAAKKQQAERSKTKAGKDAESLYSDMPQPDEEGAAATGAAMKAAANEKKDEDLGLAPEDKSKVVFLDIDGVLRPARAGTFDVSTDGDAAKPDTSDFFPAAMKALRYIMEKTSATVVLSSEWRHSDTLLKALTSIFGKNKLRVWSAVTASDRKLGKGSDALRCFAERRAEEISDYLATHEEVSGWVVLDDINLSMGDDARKGNTKVMGPHHVQTLPLIGLTKGNAKTAVRILNGDMIKKVVVERAVTPKTEK